MPDRIEPSPSGRSRCRACQKAIEKGALRLGVAVPNPFGEGEATHYYHLECGAWRQPDAFLAAALGKVEAPASAEAPAEGSAGPPAEAATDLKDAASRAAWEGLDATRQGALLAEAELSREHHRLRRFVKVERAKTARAHCRHCREAIDKGELRLCLEIIEDGRVGGAGFVHLACAHPYAGPVERTLPHLARSDEVTDQDWLFVEKALSSAG